MPLHLVHVEDDRPLKNILALALKELEPGINLQQFDSGDQALSYVQASGKTVDLFILDIRLPGTISGLQLARIIRELQCPGFIVLTSAYASPGRFLLETLRCEYFPKPWRIIDLSQRLLKYRLSNATSVSAFSQSVTSPSFPAAEKLSNLMSPRTATKP